MGDAFALTMPCRAMLAASAAERERAMDTSTELALRAIVRGLLDSNAITPEQVRSVASSLKDAAQAAMNRADPVTAKELISLSKGIKLDTTVGLEHPA